MTLIYFIISEFTLFYLLMFLILVYLDYMLSEVRLELCLCIGSYSAYSLDRWVSGRYCVGVVPIPYLSAITPYSPELEVDRGSDSPFEFYKSSFYACGVRDVLTPFLYFFLHKNPG